MAERFPSVQKASVYRCSRWYGHGVPSLQRALWSAENAATLICEGEPFPFHKVGGEVRSKEMHVHRPGWPVEVLQHLGEVQVTVRVVLSSMIEPRSNRLDTEAPLPIVWPPFDVNRPTEDEEAFRQR
jgi:hypothetical protein